MDKKEDMDKRGSINSLLHPVQKGKDYLYNLFPLHRELGREFREMRALLQKSQWWSLDEIQEFQFKNLKKIITYAYKTVPGYREVFDGHGVTPDILKNISDIKKFPIMTKEMMRKNLESFVSISFPKDHLRYVTTGGSSGTPFGFYLMRGESQAIEWAFITTMWKRVGYRNGNKSIVLRGSFVHNREKEVSWRYDPVYKDLHLSSYLLTEEYIPIFLKKIKKFKPDFMKAYPSVALILANYLVKNKVQDFPELKAILAGSECIYPSQRMFLERVFKCRVFSHYGQSEKVVLAGDCECSTDYHIFPEYGFTEILDSHGTEVTKEGEIGEIVGTSFYNLAMPFIRYRTGDLAIVSDRYCTCCRRNYRIIKRIEGRVQEYIVDKNGAPLPLAPALFSIHEKDWDRIKEIQFVQEKEGILTILVVKDERYSEEQIRNYIASLFEKKFEGRFDFKVDFAKELEKTPGGKHKYLVQRLPGDNLPTLSN